VMDPLKDFNVISLELLSVSQEYEIMFVMVPDAVLAEDLLLEGVFRLLVFLGPILHPEQLPVADDRVVELIFLVLLFNKYPTHFNSRLPLLQNLGPVVVESIGLVQEFPWNHLLDGGDFILLEILIQP